MKKRWLILAATVAAVLIVGTLGALATYFVWHDAEVAWTTRSREAAEELELGIAALERHYRSEAIEHLERALEIDPEFAIAKLYLNWTEHRDSQEFKHLLDDLRQVDRSRLTERESYMIGLWLALQDKGRPAARKILEEFLAAYSEDLFALQFECAFAWEEENWSAAEACYRRMLELHPNWYEAYDRLGTIAMAQGQFQDAEDHFRTYRYIAAEEATPYISLARLLILMGRYEEAAEEIDKAVERKEDYCPAHFQRLRLAVLLGERGPEAVEPLIERLESIGDCGWMDDVGIFCHLRAFVAYLRGDLEAAWAFMEEGCLEERGGFDVLAHRLAVATGRLEAADAMEEVLRQRMAEVEADDRLPINLDIHRAIAAHGEGMRAFFAGDAAAAIERFRRADELLRYWGDDLTTFKFINRLSLTHALRLAGRESEAETIERQITAVNPRLVSDLHLPAMERRLANER